MPGPVPPGSYPTPVDWTPGPAGSDPNAQALAVAMALLQTNPSLLTPQQFAMLQAAGIVASTLPYSSVSQIQPTTPVAGMTPTVNDPQCTAAGCTGGPYPSCTCAAAPASDLGSSLSQTLLGVPLYLWLGGGAVLFFATRRGR